MEDTVTEQQRNGRNKLHCEGHTADYKGIGRFLFTYLRTEESAPKDKGTRQNATKVHKRKEGSNPKTATFFCRRKA